MDVKIVLSLTIERSKKPTEAAEAGPGATVGTFRDSKPAPVRQRAAGRGTVGFTR